MKLRIDAMSIAIGMSMSNATLSSGDKITAGIALVVAIAIACYVQFFYK